MLSTRGDRDSMDQIRAFYERIDRRSVYTTEDRAEEHTFYPLLMRFLDKWELQSRRCLEIGSSKGLFQDVVDDYTGVDIAESLSSFYHKKFIPVLDAHLPFSKDSFDAIFTYAEHEHIPDLETALPEIVRVLKPGGVCLFAPAWHNRSWFAQGYAVRPYSDLPWQGKLIKFSIPFRDFILICWPRIFLRRLTHLLLYAISPRDIPIRYKKLKANYDQFWQSDSDACNSLDPFDVILWFRSRGIICHGQENLLKALYFRSPSLELQKPVLLE